MWGLALSTGEQWRLFRAIGYSTLALIAFPVAGWGQGGASGGEWRSYGGDSGSTKYSPLNQINKATVDGLAVVWRWRSPDNDITGPKNLAFEATPLMVNGTLYTSTSFSQVAAINAETGQTLWTHDPQTYLAPSLPARLTHRGVAYWADGADKRIFMATGDARLVSLDADTGQLDPSFGTNGEVDLRVGIPRIADPGKYGSRSPPMVYNDVVIVGSSIGDSVIDKEGPPGDVRAFDARTGALIWTFHTIPRAGEFGLATWGNDPVSGQASWEYTGAANVWAPMSLDEELGYVYLAVSCPTNNYYGGQRPGDNLFANSLVCLDALTGERIWHFQIVHHDIWDYDLSCAPNLIDVPVDGMNVKAVAQLTKHGYCFVFDRETGDPIWPIVEVAVPQSTLLNEVTSATQPVPTKPPPFERQGIDFSELLDFTPALHDAAVDIVNMHNFGPLFTPHSVVSTIVMPSIGGGANWGGGSFDPESGTLFVTSTGALPTVIGLAPPAGGNLDFISISVSALAGPSGNLSVLRPPWGSITAYDLRDGTIRWQAPNVPPFGNWGVSSSLVTKSLLFSQNRSETKLRAYDKDTGAVVWEHELGAHGTGAPMTYMVNGKQFIVVAVGTANEMTELVALALPGIPVPTAHPWALYAMMALIVMVGIVVAVRRGGLVDWWETRSAL